jgi:hypothetical protein
MAPVRRFHWDTAEYAQAFATLLRCARGREDMTARLREICAAHPAASHAVDWGAGGGDLTRLLLDRFRHVHAVEPGAEMRAQLAERCPEAHILDGSLRTAVPPAPVAVGLISHVLYHVPDEEWAECAARAAGHLEADGVLILALKAADSGCNGMLEHFGAPRFDLSARMREAADARPELTFRFERLPARIATTTFDDTLTVARFMLCDRDAAAFPRQPSEDEFREYVRKCFWDDSSGRGGWRYDELLCLVQRRRRVSG